MFQQILALIIILFFLSRLFWQKRQKRITGGEFIFWMIFWLFALMAIVFIKKIDALVASLGFSGTGIEILFYLAVIVLFYLVFKLRLSIEKMEKNLTKLVRKNALDEKNKL